MVEQKKTDERIHNELQYTGIYYYRTFLEPVPLCTEEAVGFEATPLMFVCRSQRRLLPRTIDVLNLTLYPAAGSLRQLFVVKETI